MSIKNLITFMQNSNIIRKKLYSDSTGTHYAVISVTDKAIYPADWSFKPATGNNVPIYSIVNKPAINAIRESNGKTCVLNFASAIFPGGGAFLGLDSQEESLCYSSNLYNELKLPVLRKYY